MECFFLIYLKYFLYFYLQKDKQVCGFTLNKKNKANSRRKREKNAWAQESLKKVFGTQATEDTQGWLTASTAGIGSEKNISFIPQ